MDPSRGRAARRRGFELSRTADVNAAIRGALAGGKGALGVGAGLAALRSAPVRRCGESRGRLDRSVRLAAPAGDRRQSIAGTVSLQLLLGLGYPSPFEIAVPPEIEELRVLLAGSAGIPLAFVDPAEEIEAACPGLHGGPALMA